MRKNISVGTTIPKALAKGTAAGIGVTLAGAAMMSWLIIREVLRETSIGYSAMGILLVSSYVSSAAAIHSAKRKTAIVSMVNGLIYFSVLLLTNMLCFKGGYEGVAVTGAVIAGGTGTALLLSLRDPKSRKVKARKIKRR